MVSAVATASMLPAVAPTIAASAPNNAFTQALGAALVVPESPRIADGEALFQPAAVAVSERAGTGSPSGAATLPAEAATDEATSSAQRDSATPVMPTALAAQVFHAPTDIISHDPPLAEVPAAASADAREEMPVALKSEEAEQRLPRARPARKNGPTPHVLTTLASASVPTPMPMPMPAPSPASSPASASDSARAPAPAPALAPALAPANAAVTPSAPELATSGETELATALRPSAKPERSDRIAPETSDAEADREPVAVADATPLPGATPVAALIAAPVHVQAPRASATDRKPTTASADVSLPEARSVGAPNSILVSPQEAGRAEMVAAKPRAPEGTTAENTGSGVLPHESGFPALAADSFVTADPNVRAVAQHGPAAAAKLPVPPATAEPIVIAQPGRIGHDTGVEIARRLSDGGDELIVRLVPADLGRIEVRMAFDEHGALRASIAADSPVALDMLRRDSAELSRALGDAGVRSDANSLRFQSDGGGSGTGGQQRSPWLSGDPKSAAQRIPDATPEDAPALAYRSLRTTGTYNLIA